MYLFFFKVSELYLEKKFSWKYVQVRLQDLHRLILCSFRGISCGTGEALSRACRAFLATQWTNISTAPRFNTANNDTWSWTGKEAPVLDLLCGSSLEDEIIWEGTVMLHQHQRTPREVLWSQGSGEVHKAPWITCLLQTRAVNPGTQLSTSAICLSLH